MTNDELAQAFEADFAELHSKIDALPEGALKNRAEALADVAHRALDRLRKHAVDDEVIQPMSGGGDKTPPNP